MGVVTASSYFFHTHSLTHDSGGSKLKQRYLECAYLISDLIHSDSRELCPVM